MENNESRLVLKYELSKRALSEQKSAADYWREVARLQHEANVELENSIDDMVNDMKKLMIAMYGVFIIISIAIIYQFSTF
jgi:hypothetical protein